jgi:hypothetical protein
MYKKEKIKLVNDMSRELSLPTAHYEDHIYKGKVYFENIDFIKKQLGNTNITPSNQSPPDS